MRRFRVISLVLFAGLLVGGWVMVRGLGYLNATALARVQPVPPGDQEVAWVHAATNTSSWQRFVDGIHEVRKTWPQLRLDESNAFPEQTTAVAEVVVWLEGCPQKMRIRWYKLTSELGSAQWVEELARRDPPPLAVIGGGSSDRARDLAQSLAEQSGWKGSPPLFLITTATADQVHVEPRPILTSQQIELYRGNLRDLMDIYANRTFRFCYTNSQMAEAVIDFLWSRPDLRPHGSPTVALQVAAQGLSGDLWGMLPLAAEAAPAMLPSIYAFQWLDDPYSIDLASQFGLALQKAEYATNPVVIGWLPYSVGGYYGPNLPEAQAANLLALQWMRHPDQRPLLVLPAVDRPARRFLRALASVAPLELRRAVVATGDSISFNTIYRDRDIAWSFLDMPLPLVFFCHQDPVQWHQEDEEFIPPPYETASDDMLLNADIVRILLEGAYGLEPDETDPSKRVGVPRLLGDANSLRERFHARQPPYFEANGNRRGGYGEYVVTLMPYVDNGRVLPIATIEVWHRQRDFIPDTMFPTRWQMVKKPIFILDESAGRSGP